MELYGLYWLTYSNNNQKKKRVELKCLQWFSKKKKKIGSHALTSHGRERIDGVRLGVLES